MRCFAAEIEGVHDVRIFLTNEDWEAMWKTGGNFRIDVAEKFRLSKPCFVRVYSAEGVLKKESADDGNNGSTD